MESTRDTESTVNQILDLYEHKCIPDLAPRTQKDYRRHLVKLRHIFGARIAKELVPRDFGPFLDVKQGKHQRVKQLAVLSAAFTQAVSAWYMIDRNVLRDVKRPKSKPRDRLVEAQEFSTLRSIAPYRVQLAMDLAVMMGQRQGDLLSLKWADIRDMAVIVYQSKTGKRLAIEITPDLESVLDKCWQLPARGEFVLTRRYGGRYTGEGFRAMWQRTMRKYVKGGGTRFTFHDLRALAATRCGSPEIAMRLLGHSNISMTMRVYRRGVERVKALSLAG